MIIDTTTIGLMVLVMLSTLELRHLWMGIIGFKNELRYEKKYRKKKDEEKKEEKKEE